MKKNFLNRHLIETGENYFEHFLFSFVLSMWVFLISIAFLFHTIFPFFCMNTASKNIKKLNEVMEKRANKLNEEKDNGDKDSNKLS